MKVVPIHAVMIQRWGGRKNFEFRMFDFGFNLLSKLNIRNSK